MVPPKNQKCAGCDVFLNKQKRTKTVNNAADVAKYSESTGRRILIGDQLCDPCRLCIYRSGPSTHRVSFKRELQGLNYSGQESRQQTDSVNIEASSPTQIATQSSASSSIAVTSSSSQSSTSSGFTIVEKIRPQRTFVELDIPRVVSTHRYCFVCGDSELLRVVSKDLRKHAFKKSRIFIPLGNRCCPTHVINDRLYENEIEKLRLNIFSYTSSITTDEVTEFLNHLAMQSQSTMLHRIRDSEFSDERVQILTGLNQDQLRTLSNSLTTMRNSGRREVVEALVMFLLKLRSGNSNCIIASILERENEQEVSEACASVINAFQKDVLPKKFGTSATEVSRQFLLTQTSPIAKRLFQLGDDRLALVFDGTYISTQKSTNNEYQRRSYSGQKKKPLVKPFTISTTNGYIVDVCGPYSGNKNDAEIMKDVIRTTNLLGIMKAGDVCVVDRGFRDVVQYLEELGFVVYMPALKGKRKQLTTQESNDSRIVTMVRWVVESVHGLICQKFRLLHHQVDNKLLPNIAVYCKIACWLNNHYGKRLNQYSDITEEVLRQVNQRKDVSNSLANEVEEKGWSRKRVIYEQLSSDDIIDFPELTERDLKIFFTGTYQLKQSISYLAELLNPDDNTLPINYVRETDTIIRCEVRSRHINSQTYKCYIEYERNAIGCGGIKRYCCDCANGNRTVGCCSHLATIIYFLSHARYLSRVIRPAKILSSLFKIDEMVPVINEDSDED